MLGLASAAGLAFEDELLVVDDVDEVNQEILEGEREQARRRLEVLRARAVRVDRHLVGDVVRALDVHRFHTACGLVRTLLLVGARVNLVEQESKPKRDHS